MKKFLSAAALVLSLLALQPTQSQAAWNAPQTRQGFGWFQGMALNTVPWLHFHGPLYNYGPYNIPGHVPNFVKNPIVGAYVPAYPPAYYGYEYPAYAPNTIQPYFPQPMQAPAPPNFYPQVAPPVVAAPLATAPASSQQPTAEPAVSTYSNGRTPIFFGASRRRR